MEPIARAERATISWDPYTRRTTIQTGASRIVEPIRSGEEYRVTFLSHGIIMGNIFTAQSNNIPGQSEPMIFTRKDWEMPDIFE